MSSTKMGLRKVTLFDKEGDDAGASMKRAGEPACSACGG